MRVFVFFIMVCIGLSCSSKWHLRRAIKKNPKIIDTLFHKKDTVFVLKQDTLYLDSISTQFIYRLDTLLKDTCILSHKNKIAIKYILKKEILPKALQSLRKDTLFIPIENGMVKIWLNGDSLSASIRYKTTIIQDPYKREEHGWITFFKKNWWISIVLIVLAVLIFIKKNLYN